MRNDTQLSGSDQALGKIAWYGLLVLVLASLLAGQFNHDLWTPDEPRVAAIVKEMIERNDYVVPHLAGQPFVEKPPLYFVVGALLVQGLADSIGVLNALRLQNVLLGAGVLWLSWLMAFRLSGRETAQWTVIILATLPGFLANYHWLRVDPGLAFFMLASTWALLAGFQERRPALMLLAGLFAAGAFLSKGLIGPLLLAFAWLPLFLWVWPQRAQCAGFLWLGHLAALLGLLLPSLAWMLALRLHADGEALWQVWFWDNHVGRLSGSSSHLGHIKSGEYFYYLPNLAIYTLPWLYLVATQLVRDSLTLWRERRLPMARVFLWSWLLGGLVLLSASSTKRALYLLPLLPAIAMLAALALTQAGIKSLRWFALGWTALCAFILLAVSQTPWFATSLADRVPPAVLAELSEWNLFKLVSLLIAVLIGVLGWRFRRNAGLLLGSATALLFFAVLTVVLPSVDLAKSMREDTLAFLEQVPVASRAGIAGWNFKETELALLYYHGDWAVPQLPDRESVVGVLRHQDPRYNSVIVNKIARGEADVLTLMGFKDAPDFRVVAEGHPRVDKEKQGLYWLIGQRPAEIVAP